MFRVMIVDDEPPFIRIIKKLIGQYSEEFAVVGEAFDGFEALNILPQVKPDVIFADIKMPGMDGIALLKKVNELYPYIMPVIVSGYKDFEFAKEALKTGALEYLLKPINPELINGLLKQISSKLGAFYLKKEKELLLTLASNRQVSREEIQKYFDYKGFMCAILRKGALVQRHANSIPYQQERPFEGVDFDTPTRKHQINKCWILDGSDENEVILVAAVNEYDARHAGNVFTGIFEEVDGCMGNITMLYGPCFFHIDQLAIYLEPLVKRLNQCLVIGSSQIIDCNNLPVLNENMVPIIDKSTENKLRALIESKALKLLKAEFTKMFMDWEQKRYPQVWVSKMLKQVMILVEKHSHSISAITSLNLEEQLDEVLSICNSMGELMRAVWDIAEEMLGDMENKGQESCSAIELLEKVDTYVLTNLAATVSLQSVCKIFGMSQPYISRLFRKYKNVSFNEYVTRMKIEKAKQVISECPGMLLKDIAEVTGFRDQYYFSKIFKYITGINPSEYRADGNIKKS